MCRPLTAGSTGACDVLPSNLVEEYQRLEQVQPVPAQFPEEQPQHRVVDAAEQDALARAAGQLIESLREEQNPKFKNSQFIGLMRSLADRTSVVEGSDIVLATSVSDTTTSTSAGVKGKGKERADLISTFDQTPQAHPRSVQIGGPFSGQPLTYAQGQTSDTTITSDVNQDSHDEVYEYFKQENEEYIAYHQAVSKVATQNTGEVWYEDEQSFHWDKLQGEWDAWEANAVGVRKMSSYRFAAENPYLLGSSTRVHDMHSVFDQVGVLDADH